jgi:peptidoglycan/LPS O-acetylase OafA/YrhL
LTFREDINGLRALAVIAVVLFHFEPQWLPGGFAGVDVFFVISGFLMTGIIFKGLEKEEFSVLRFYIARANRIIPALAVLCIVLMIFGWFFLIPKDYEQLGKHVASSLTFASNITYWKEVGYFDTLSLEKWLLHTWSLSVEWQFYIIYPLILAFLRVFMSILTLKKIVLLGTVLGFIFSAAVTNIWPDGAYYLLPTRAWEMMIGGVAYLYPLSIKEHYKKYLEWFALTLIIGSYFLISKENPWPGYLAIIPVFGTFLIIQAQISNSLVTGNFIFQKLGAWSYSIYLWHWPIVVAIYYFSLSDAFTYLGIMGSILLGFLSSTYIEKIKFKSNYDSLKSYFAYKPFYLAVIGSILGAAIYINSGFISRVTGLENVLAVETPKHYNFCFDRVDGRLSDEYCVFKADGTYSTKISSKVDVIVLGDSHAVGIINSVLLSQRRNLKMGNVVLFGHPSCLPIEGDILKIEHTDRTEACNFRNAKIIELIKEIAHKETRIIINARASLYIFGKNERINYKPFRYIHYMLDDVSVENNAEILFAAHTSLINSIKSIADTFVVLPIPEQKLHIPKLLEQNIFFKKNKIDIGIKTLSYQERSAFVRKEYLDINGITLIDPSVMLCNSSYCKVEVDLNPLYYDDNHLSIFGAEYISELFDVIWRE